MGKRTTVAQLIENFWKGDKYGKTPNLEVKLNEKTGFVEMHSFERHIATRAKDSIFYIWRGVFPYNSHINRVVKQVETHNKGKTRPITLHRISNWNTRSLENYKTYTELLVAAGEGGRDTNSHMAQLVEHPILTVQENPIAGNAIMIDGEPCTCEHCRPHE